MSMKGRMLQQGVATGVTAAQARAYAKQGLLTQSPSNGPFQSAPLPFVDPMAAFVWMDDFIEYPLNDSDEVGWVETDIQGTNTASIGALADIGHNLKIVTGASAGDAISIQWHHAFVIPTTTGKLWFEARIQKGAASADAPFMIGLCGVDTTPFASAPTTGIWFEGVSSGVIQAHCNDTGGSEVNTAISTLAASTWMRLGAFLDYGNEKLEFWIDDGLALTYTNMANVPDAVGLTPTMALKRQSAAETMYVDYMKVVQTR